MNDQRPWQLSMMLMKMMMMVIDLGKQSLGLNARRQVLGGVVPSQRLLVAAQEGPGGGGGHHDRDARHEHDTSCVCFGDANIDRISPLVLPYYNSRKL